MSSTASAMRFSGVHSSPLALRTADWIDPTPWLADWILAEASEYAASAPSANAVLGAPAARPSTSAARRSLPAKERGIGSSERNLLFRGGRGGRGRAGGLRGRCGRPAAVGEAAHDLLDVA